MSGDCAPMDTLTPQEAPSKPLREESYPMRSTVSRTIDAMSTYPAVVTSPAMCTWPVVIMVSTATRLRGSCASIASRIESLIWSAILSGWPSVTDSEVKRRRGTRYSLGTVARSTSAATERTLPAPRYPAPRKPRCGARRSRLPVRRGGQLGHDGGPDPRGDGVLAVLGQFGHRSVGSEHGHGVVGAAEDLAA